MLGRAKSAGARRWEDTVASGPDCNDLHADGGQPPMSSGDLAECGASPNEQFMRDPEATYGA